MENHVSGRFVVAQLRTKAISSNTHWRGVFQNLHKGVSVLCGVQTTQKRSLQTYTKKFNETRGMDLIGSQMWCQLLTVIKPKACGLEHLPYICPVPGEHLSRLWLLEVGCCDHSWAPHPDVQLFLLLPDLQQGEQLCCKYWIAASIIDFLGIFFFNTYWDVGNQIPGSLENLSSKGEELLSWKLVFSEAVCLIDVAIIPTERRCVIKQRPYLLLWSGAVWIPVNSGLHGSKETYIMWILSYSHHSFSWSPDTCILKAVSLQTCVQALGWEETG